MRDYDYTTTTPDPDEDDLPDECQYVTCTDTPTMYVRFRTPKEYVVYCKQHATLMYSSNDNTSRKGQLS